MWKSFLLRPYPEPRPLEKFRRYTRSWLVPAGQSDGGRFREWSTEESPPSHSVPPSVAVKAAAQLGGEMGFEAYHLAVMDAYFYANRNVTEETTLVEIAVACGFERERFRACLHDTALAQSVLDDHNEAIQIGVTGVPTVLVDGGLLIPGAQDLRFYRHLVAKLQPSPPQS